MVIKYLINAIGTLLPKSNTHTPLESVYKQVQSCVDIFGWQWSTTRAVDYCSTLFNAAQVIEDSSLFAPISYHGSYAVWHEQYYHSCYDK